MFHVHTQKRKYSHSISYVVLENGWLVTFPNAKQYDENML